MLFDPILNRFVLILAGHFVDDKKACA